MEGFCRGCLNKFHEPTDLIQYCESNRRLFVYSTGLQVKRNDAFTFQLCKECYLSMKLSCNFKKQCRNSDKKFKNYLAYIEDGDGMDFSTYLKNVEDTFPLRIPKLSSSSTPSHNKNYDDDDNVSTCTSIQNFMADMLEGEEMAPTEAQIIREVIQEEADIMDDSLDSHWLQEDISEDFGMDFNFGAFSTPRSVHNDHCYTPKRLPDDKEEQINFYMHRKIIERPDETNVAQNIDMPILDDCIPLNDINNGKKHEINYYGIGTETVSSTAHKYHMPILDDCNIEFDGVVSEINTVDDLETDDCTERIKEPDKKNLPVNGELRHDDSFTNELREINKEKNLFVKLESFKNDLFSNSNDLSPFLDGKKVKNEETAHEFMLSSENEISVILGKGIAEKKVTGSPLTCELEYYITKASLNKSSITKICDSKVGKAINNETVDGATIIQGKTVNPSIIKAKINTECISISNTKAQMLNIITANTNLTNIVQQNHETNIEDSPVKLELEQFINKAELQKKSNQCKAEGNNAYDSIDKNLEIALKNNESHEFSLDQLLHSPKDTLRSGASTPTINNILFGGMTPKNTGTDILEMLKDTAIKQEPIEFIEEFLKDNSYERQSASTKCHGIAEIKKEIENIDEIKTDTIIKDEANINGTRGHKDIHKFRQIFKEDKSPPPLEENIDPISVTKNKEFDGKPLHQTDVIEDLDISVSNLLNLDDSKSIDLNFSISSDFLKETDKLDESDVNREYPFKRPFTPLYEKFDLQNYRCTICDITYTAMKPLRNHAARKHNYEIEGRKSRSTFLQPKYCEYCGKSFRYGSNLKKHIRAHEGPEYFRCTICTLPFDTQGKLRQHMRAHSGELEKYKIEFDEINNKSDGVKEKSDGIKDKSDEVNDESDGIKDKPDGIKNKTDDKAKDKKKYVCSTCGHVTTILANFKLHQRRHTKSYTVKCDECGKGFYRNSDLNQHMTSHTGEYEFHCEFCPKKYKRRDLLRQHLYRHLGKTVFPCDVCDLNFFSKSKLKQHFSSISCQRNRDALANEAAKDTAKHNVTLTNVVGSTAKIKKMLNLSETRKKVSVGCSKMDIDIKDESLMKEQTNTDSVKDPISTKVMKSSVKEESSETKDLNIDPLETVKRSTKLFLEIADGSQPVTPEAMEEG